MSDRTNHVTSTFWGCVQNSNVVTAGGDVQLTLANGAVLSLRQEDWVDFSDLITKVTQRLVGRGFVFEKVADFIQSNPCGYFRVIADAGLGKTAIAAELTKRYLAVACFISASENRTQPERIINILSAQLVARYALPYNSLPVRAGETSDWFYQRLREAASQPENRPVVVIIDAIDETDAPAPTRNWLYLPRDLPQGVYIILTHRPGDYLLTTVPNLPYSEQVITSDDPKQQSDIELHLHCQAEQPEIRQLLEKTTPSISVEEFVSELQKASQGNFMYLEYVLADIVAGNSGFNPLNLKELPQGLRGYYAQFWSGMEAVRHKEGWPDWNSLYRPIIELLGVALESVSVQWLADHIRRDTNEIRVRALQSWQRFLSQNRRESIETWRLVHQSFANFLEKKVDLTATHRRVVEYYLTQGEPRKKHGGYADRHLSTHLSIANLWDEFANRIDSLHWLKPDSPEAIIDRIATGIYTENDLAALTRELTVSSNQQVIQLGKYNINIGQGQDIHIGDRVYQGVSAAAIQEELFREVLRQQFFEVLLDAFPDFDSLNRMLHYKLDESLEQIVGHNDNYKQAVFKLIKWFEVRGQLPELLTAAVRENPGNLKMQVFYQQMLETTSVEEYNIQGGSVSPQEPAEIELTNEQRQQLIEAMRSAFPSVTDLEILVDFRLDANLSALSAYTNYTEVAFNLITWAEEHKRLSELLTVAVKQNSTNRKLRDFCKQVLGASFITDDSSSPQSPAEIDLTGSQRQHLVKALKSTFSSLEELEIIVYTDLNENLNQIIGRSDSYDQAAFKLVKWAETQGKLSQLLTVARHNSSDPKLQSFYQQVRETPSVEQLDGQDYPSSLRPTAVMRLTRVQHGHLVEALTSAFPSFRDFEMIVDFGLDESLEQIVGHSSSYIEVVFKLIKWAEEHQRLSQLLTAAVKENPVNPKLRNFYEQVLGTPSVADDLSDPQPAADIELTGWQRKQFIEALCEALQNAFPGDLDLVNNLDKVVSKELGESCKHIAGRRFSLITTLFKLIKWAEARGRVSQLITAVNNNFSDQKLQSFYEQVVQTVTGKELNAQKDLSYPQPTTEIKLTLLTSAKRKQLHEALIDAFPAFIYLEMMVDFLLDESLEQIAGHSSSYEGVVFNLIKWAEAEGRLPELLTAAVRENPGNPKLYVFYQTASVEEPKA